MSSHYEIVHDTEELRKFLLYVLPTEAHHAIVLQTFARRKYDKSLPVGTCLINRTILSGRTPIDTAVNRVQRLQVPLGLYTCGSDNSSIPNGALVTYALIRPKDMVRALTKTLTQCVTDLTGRTEKPRDPLSTFRVEIGKSGAILDDPPFVQVDLDTKDPDQVDHAIRILKAAGVEKPLWIETRGGYHIVYRAHENIDKKTLYEYGQSTRYTKLSVDGKEVTDQVFSLSKEPNVAVPGTYQGSFRVRCVDIKYE